jgi:hypothetical protein
MKYIHLATQVSDEATRGMQHICYLLSYDLRLMLFRLKALHSSKAEETTKLYFPTYEREWETLSVKG